MENTNKKRNLKLFFIGLLATILVGVSGFLIYWFLIRTPEETSISLNSGKFYPAFSESVNNYKIYTSDSSLTFTCTGDGAIAGCDTPVQVSASVSNYTITIGENSYTFEIHRVKSNETTLTIKNVKNNPTSWVSSADLTVVVENLTSVPELEYSFDNGKTWQTKNSKTITKNGVYKIQVRDYFGFVSKTETVNVNKVDSVGPTVDISTEELDDETTVLTAVAADELSGIDAYSWNTGATSESITVNVAGTYTVSVTDKAKNVTKKSVIVRSGETAPSNLPTTDTSESSSSSTPSETTPAPTPSPSPTPTPSPVSVRRVAIFVGNGAVVGATSLACETSSTSCTINAPSIDRAGYEIIGWAESPDATSAVFTPGTDVTLYSNPTFYAVTRKKLSASFSVTVARAADKSGSDPSCYVYNLNSSCSVTAPTLTGKNGYSVHGWSEKKDSTSASVASGATFSLSGNEAFYSVISKKVSASFTSADIENVLVGDSSLSCDIFNTNSSCQLTPPSTTVGAGFELLGWGEENGTTEVKFRPDSVIPISGGETFYTVSRNATPLVSTFVIEDEPAATMSGGLTRCYRYNGESSCMMVAPVLSANDGYVAFGWSKTSGSSTVFLNSGETFYPTTSRTYYAVTSTDGALNATFVLLDDDAAVKSSVDTSCIPETGTSSCSVSVPTLTEKPGYTVLGWSLTRGSTSPDLEPSVRTLEISSNVTYYSVTKLSFGFSASFTLQDSANLTASATSLSCDVFNGASSCTVNTPTLTPNSSDFTVLGWATASGATVASIDPSSDPTITLSSSLTSFYSVSRKTSPLQASFQVDSSKAKKEGGETFCYLYNGATSCSITAPVLTATASGYTALGWSETSGSSTAELASGGKTTLSADKTFYSVLVAGVSATFVNQNTSAATMTGSGTASCTFSGSATSCDIVLPTLSAENGYTVLGWSENKDATSADYPSGATVSLSSEKTFYSITSKTVTETFILQDKTNFTFSDNTTANKSLSCTFYNKASSCSIDVPGLTSKNSGFQALGFNASASATSSSLTAGSAHSFTDSGTYYSITRTSTAYTATFTLQNSYATASASSASCRPYNGETSCQITIPTLTSNSSNYTALGWNTNAGAFRPLVSNNDNYRLNSASTTFYSLVFRSYVANVYKNTADSVSYSATKCYIYTFSGETTEGCYIQDIPHIYARGKQIPGYSDSATGSYLPLRLADWDKDQLAAGATLSIYALTTNIVSSPFSISALRTIDISDVSGTSGDYYSLEYDQGIGSSVIDYYTSYTTEAFGNIPALKRFYGKTWLISSENYDASTYNSQSFQGSAGLTITSGDFAPVYIKIYHPNAAFAYTKHAIIHEYGHALDALFLENTNKWLHDYPEFRSEYNTASNLPSSGRPLSTYAYTNEFEFLAEAFTAYYHDEFGGYKDSSLGDTTENLNNAFKKYLCIADHNFNEGADCE